MSDRDKRAAINLAIALMENRIGEIAFNANLEEFYAADLPVTRSASKERKRLKKAIEVLEELAIGKEPISETLNILNYIGEANY